MVKINNVCDIELKVKNSKIKMSVNVSGIVIINLVFVVFKFLN